MVQKKSQSRGRPRAYDAESALSKALEAFWKAGYDGTSIDELSAAMGMNKPSVYAGFGDKKTIYLKALDLYRTVGRELIEQTLLEHPGLKEALQTIANNAIESYTKGDFSQRGCFMVGTAPAAAATDPDVKARLDAAIREFDRVLEQRFALAKSNGEPVIERPPAQLARMFTDMIFGLALRARAGATPAELQHAARDLIDVICMT